MKNKKYHFVVQRTKNRMWREELHISLQKDAILPRASAEGAQDERRGSGIAGKEDQGKSEGIRDCRKGSIKNFRDSHAKILKNVVEFVIFLKKITF